MDAPPLRDGARSSLEQARPDLPARPAARQRPMRQSAQAHANTYPRAARRGMPDIQPVQGLTLVELMTVLAILTLLGTFGLTAFGEVLARYRVQTALHLISADLAMARMAAITRRSPIVACPGNALHGCRSSADWSAGWIVFMDPDGNRRPDDAADVLRAADAPSGAPNTVRLVSTRSFVRYQRDGRSAGTNLTINVCRAGMLGGQVVVNNLGRIRSSRPATDRPCPFGAGER